MLEIPLMAYVNQGLLVVLGEQECSVAIYQRGTGMYLDLYNGGETVCQGAICQPGMGIVQVATSAFSGQLYLLDTLSRGNEQQDPKWEGLGTRWRLYWLDAEEVDAIETENFKAALNG